VPKISVIIPSYNHEKFIAETIKSVLDQSFQDLEIIITDDGSTDKTVDEIKNFSDPRIKLFIFEENQGACLAANNCIRHSKGEYISMLSSDDIFLPGKLEKQIHFFNKNRECAAVFSYARLIDEDGFDFEEKNHYYYSIFKQPNRTRHEWLNYFFYKGNCLCHPSMLIRAECYENVGCYDPRFAQLPDLDFWIRLCLKDNIHILPEDLIKLRIRRDRANVSGARPDSVKRHLLEFSVVLNNYLEIKTSQELLKIFPEAEKLGIIQDESISYFIAKLALEFQNPPHQQFGMQTLFRLFVDKQAVDRLYTNYGVNYIDLNKLSGLFDIFGLDQIGVLESQNRLLQSHTEYLEAAKADLEAAKADLEKRLTDIYNSRGWRLLTKGYQLKESILHPGSILKNRQKNDPVG